MRLDIIQNVHMTRERRCCRMSGSQISQLQDGASRCVYDGTVTSTNLCFVLDCIGQDIITCYNSTKGKET
jgi:hypothetical protein